MNHALTISFLLPFLFGVSAGVAITLAVRFSFIKLKKLVLFSHVDNSVNTLNVNFPHFENRPKRSETPYTPYGIHGFAPPGPLIPEEYWPLPFTSEGMEQ